MPFKKELLPLNANDLHLGDVLVQPDFNKSNLLPVIIQDEKSAKVLMLGYMDSEAYKLTCKEKIVYYFSRSKNRIWKKGESSGHIQKVKSIYLDCDLDTILVKVEQIGDAACHKGFTSCFYTEVTDGNEKIVEEKIFNPDDVYK